MSNNIRFLNAILCINSLKKGRNWHVEINFEDSVEVYHFILSENEKLIFEKVIEKVLNTKLILDQKQKRYDIEKLCYNNKAVGFCLCNNHTYFILFNNVYQAYTYEQMLHHFKKKEQRKKIKKLHGNIKGGTT